MNTQIKAITEGENDTTLRVLLVPFGSPSRKDLHNEFFDKDTYFGLDIGVKSVYAMYDHHFNDVQNPYADKNQIIGKAVYAETDADGLWYDFEVRKSHAYHDGLVRLAKGGFLGASSGTYPGGKALDPNVAGRISRWIIGEGSLTVSPASPDTIGKVTALAKSTNLPLPSDFKTIVDEAAAPPATAPVVVEPVVEPPATAPVVAPEPVVENEALSTFEEEVAEILATPPPAPVSKKPATKSVDTDVLLAKIDELDAKLKFICAYFDIGGTADEFKEDMGVLGAVLSSMRSVDTTMQKIVADQVATQNVLKSFAVHIKNIKSVEVQREVAEMSQIEKSEFGRILSPDRVAPRTSLIPMNAPGG